MNFNIDIFAQCCKEIDKFDIAYLITGVYEPLLNLVDLSPVTCYLNLCGQIKDEQYRLNQIILVARGDMRGWTYFKQMCFGTTFLEQID